MSELPGAGASSSSPKSGRSTLPFSLQGSDRSGLPVPSASTGSIGAPISGSSTSSSHSLLRGKGLSAGLPGISWVWLVMGIFFGWRGSRHKANHASGIWVDQVSARPLR